MQQDSDGARRLSKSYSDQMYSTIMKQLYEVWYRAHSSFHYRSLSFSMVIIIYSSQTNHCSTGGQAGWKSLICPIV